VANDEKENLNVVQVDTGMMEEVVRRIVETISPYKVILFGSQAQGDARPESDIDLLVIAESTQPRYRRSAPLYGALSDILVPMDILVYSPEEVNRLPDDMKPNERTSSRQEDTWGANWIPSTQQVRYEALLNIRPRQNNPAMEILDPSIRDRVAEIVRSLLEGV
jgi:predicted nucleotidyltransferase